ncbi:hypothetical protein JCM13304A_03100 [Desulfothermus okinawensis JCM 13304]
MIRVIIALIFFITCATAYGLKYEPPKSSKDKVNKRQKVKIQQKYILQGEKNIAKDIYLMNSKNSTKIKIQKR